MKSYYYNPKDGYYYFVWPSHSCIDGGRDGEFEVCRSTTFPRGERWAGALMLALCKDEKLAQKIAKLLAENGIEDN